MDIYTVYICIQYNIYIYNCSRWGYKPAYDLEAPSCTHVSFPVVMFAFLYPQTLGFPKMRLHTPQIIHI